MARDIKEGRLSGFVGHGTTLTGETQFHAMLRVDGHLIGTVSSESGTLIIGTNGQVDANILVAAANWLGAQDSIRANRLAKAEAAKACTTQAALDAVAAQWAAYVSATRTGLGL